VERILVKNVSNSPSLTTPDFKIKYFIKNRIGKRIKKNRIVCFKITFIVIDVCSYGD